MSLKGILQAFVSLTGKAVSSTGTTSVEQGSRQSNELALDNGFYAEVGVPVIDNFPRKRRRLFSLKWLLHGTLVVTALLAAKEGYGQTVTYTGSPYTFTVGSSIGAVATPTVGGTLARGQTSSITANGITITNTVTAVAVDPTNTFLYITDQGTGGNGPNVIFKLPIAGGTGTTFVNGGSLNNPTGIVVDAAGNVFVANQGTNQILKYNSSGTIQTFTISGVTINTPGGLALDAGGFLYVANSATSGTNANSILKINTSTGAGSVLASGFNAPKGVAVDPNNSVNPNVYVANSGSTTITKVTSAGATSTYATLPVSPTGVAVDAQGIVYVSEEASQNHFIERITAVSTFSIIAGAQTTGGTLTDGTGANARFGNPLNYIAINTLGDLYAADAGNTRIRKVITSGIDISPNLPAGLSFNPSTGAITGTPTTAQAQTSYTVTPYGTSGVGTTSTIQITVTAGTLSITNPASAYTTTYGTATAGQSITVTGSGLTAGNVTVTAPTGFELSTTSNGTYTSSLTLTSTTTINQTIFLRLAANAAAGSYASKSVTATQGSITGSDVIPTSTVSKATLSVTANAVPKTYGTALTGGSGSTPEARPASCSTSPARASFSGRTARPWRRRLRRSRCRFPHRPRRRSAPIHRGRASAARHWPACSRARACSGSRPAQAWPPSGAGWATCRRSEPSRPATRGCPTPPRRSCSSSRAAPGSTTG